MVENSVAEKSEFAQILKCALDLGEMMHICGGEVSRVEDTVSRICYSYGARRVDTLTITSSIVVTVIADDGEIITQTRRIKGQARDMEKLSELNRLSRDICAKHIPPEQVESEIARIAAERPMKWQITAAASILAAGSFTVFFGGTWRDVIAVALVATVIFLSERLRSVIHTNKIAHYLITSFASGALSVLLVYSGLGENINAIIIGAIMLLIPGVSITGALEDLLTGDTITGLLCFCESIITAIAIAVGFAGATFICGGADMLMPGTAEVIPWVQIAAATLSSAGFSLLFGVRHPRHIAVATIGGGITWAVYLLFDSAGLSLFPCMFFASLVGEAYAQVMARLMCSPATVFIIPAIIPLVPGSMLFYTMSWALRGDLAKFTDSGTDTLISALAIALGMVLVILAFSVVTSLVRRARIKKAVNKKGS